MSLMRSSTETSIRSLITYYSLSILRGCSHRFSRIGLHDVVRDFDKFSVASPDRFEVVLYNTFAALAKILTEGFFDAGEKRFIADTAFRGERRHAQEYAQQHNALHALLQVGQGRNFL